MEKQRGMASGSGRRRQLLYNRIDSSSRNAISDTQNFGVLGVVVRCYLSL
jgi:hypothetical protein